MRVASLWSESIMSGRILVRSSAIGGIEDALAEQRIQDLPDRLFRELAGVGLRVLVREGRSGDDEVDQRLRALRKMKSVAPCTQRDLVVCGPVVQHETLAKGAGETSHAELRARGLEQLSGKLDPANVTIREDAMAVEGVNRFVVMEPRQKSVSQFRQVFPEAPFTRLRGLVRERQRQFVTKADVALQLIAEPCHEVDARSRRHDQRQMHGRSALSQGVMPVSPRDVQHIARRQFTLRGGLARRNAENVHVRKRLFDGSVVNGPALAAFDLQHEYIVPIVVLPKRLLR